MQTLNIVLPAATGMLIGGPGCLVAHATQETTGSAAAHYRLWDGPPDSGNLLVPVSLSADQSTRDMFPSHIIKFSTDLWYELVDGALEGAVSVRVEHSCDEIEHAAMLLVLHGYPE